MPRKPRQLLNAGYYHLIARGNNRLFIFQITDGFKTFKRILKQSKEIFPWRLFHYCLMGNHLHLLAQIERGKDLPKLMQYLLSEYARWYRKKTGYLGHLWQTRYKSPLIEKESYFLECGRYIERNPVRAEIVKQAEEYPWSSYRYYALGQPDELIDEDPYYEGLGNSGAERRSYYKHFAGQEGPYDRLIEQLL